MVQFGSFQTLCRNIPSYPWCNLFYRQLLDNDPAALAGSSANANSAPVGVDPVCGIARLHHGSPLGNIANTIACGLSVFVVLYLSTRVGRRRAAVGRVELRAFLVAYALSLALQLLDTGSYLKQGGTALVAITAVHAGVVAMVFWFLLANAIVATQIVEDGTPSSMIPYAIIGAAFFAATTFVALDTALLFTQTFRSDTLQNIGLFVLLNIWPGAAALIYTLIMLYVVFVNLQELRPLLYYLVAALAFILSQLDVFLLSRIICTGTGAKVDGSFVATLLESASVGIVYLAWRSITEEDWSDDVFYGN